MRECLLILLLNCQLISFSQVTGVFKDERDGMIYKTMVVGNQIWMNQNLNVDRFQNGDLIPEVKNDMEWKKAGEQGRPAWCYYKNDPNNGVKYGKLYNWFAVNDKRGLAPKGWHIASSWDWSELIENLGGKEVSDEMSQMRYLNFTSIDFNLVTGGSRNSNGDGKFDSPKEFDLWWNSASYSGETGNNAFARFLKIIESDNVKYNANVYFFVSEDGGMSVRCIKD
jgi:uncharacterized protein (TIGR02145 family)